jgi:hypothetical protein
VTKTFSGLRARLLERQRAARHQLAERLALQVLLHHVMHRSAVAGLDADVVDGGDVLHGDLAVEP